MTIAVHISSPDNDLDLTGDFNFNCFCAMAESQHGHHFIFLFDKAFDASLITCSNITPVTITPPIRNRLMQHYWYNFKLTRVLEKYNADFFFGKEAVVSLRTKVPQCMTVHDPILKEKEKDRVGSIKTSKKYFKKFIEKADLIFATNPVVKKQLEKTVGKKHKLQLLEFGLPTSDVSVEEILSIKEEHTNGAEYFLAFITNSSVQNIIMLLKAFSAFKKRQLSNMKLLLLISSTQKEGLVKDFANYKYRDEVKMIVPGDRDTRIKLVAASYASIYLPSQVYMENEGLLSISNKVPLLTLKNEFAEGLYGNAALYAKPDEKSIAENMMLLYKDENLRNGLIREAMAMGSTNSWEQVAGKLWNTLVHGAEQ